MPSVKEVLEQARELISKPEAWTKGGYYATDKNGEFTFPGSPNAKCFCMVGAVTKAAGLKYGEDAYGRGLLAPIVKAVKARAAGLYIPEFNDLPETTHADVLAVFDEAIASVSE